MFRRMLTAHRRQAVAAFVIVATVLILGLVTISPFALVGLAHYRHDWSKLSNIGQTYGAVSALLSSLALTGVASSLLYQARDSQTAREQTTRVIHNELIKMEMADPSLMTAVGAPWGLSIPPDSLRIRQFLYIQMWISFLCGRR